MKPELSVLYRRFQSLQLEVHELLQGIPARVHSTAMEDLVDAGFMCREISKICDDLRISCDKTQSVVSKYICARTSVDSLQGKEVVLKGELATATPDLVVKPNIPDRGSQEYVDLMRWIGLSDEMIQRDMLRPSFTRIQEILTERAVRGEKPPPGISATFTEAVVVFRKRKVAKSNGNKEEF